VLHIVIALMGAASLLLPSVTQSQDTTRAAVRRRSTYEDLQLFSQVLNQLRVNHPDALDSHDLIMAAIQGMVRAADPHSYVITAVRLSPELELLQRSGKLTPLPVTFTFVGGTPVVAGVAAGTKAAQQDIVVGDELMAVDGRTISATGAEELELTLSGAPRSAATITLERRRSDGTRVRIERRVLRQQVDEVTAVPVATMLDGSTGYIRVTTFANSQIADDLHKSLEQLERGGMQRLVLDLRDNGGGIVQQAAQVAGEFLPAGTIIYTSNGRKREVIDTGRVKRSFWRSERRYPIVVMVNEGTASASELVAGALQDHDRALIVGRPTFGKALLMQGFPLSDGSVIVLVVGHVRTPCGRLVQREYRAVSTRDYYRLATAERDTAGRPSCRTSGGRVVYGGGGVYPDRLLPVRGDVAPWFSRLNEADVWLEWLGVYLNDEGARLGALDAFVATDQLSPAAVTALRSTARRHEIVIPDDADAILRAVMRQVVAQSKWGDAGALLLRARTDPQVQEAIASFDRATGLVGPGR